ncbi:hypothetical protein L0F63_003624, partial [Massospora cicadina]
MFHYLDSSQSIWTKSFLLMVQMYMRCLPLVWGINWDKSKEKHIKTQAMEDPVQTLQKHQQELDSRDVTSGRGQKVLKVPMGIKCNVAQGFMEKFTPGHESIASFLYAFESSIDEDTNQQKKHIHSFYHILTSTRPQFSKLPVTKLGVKDQACLLESEGWIDWLRLVEPSSSAAYFRLLPVEAINNVCSFGILQDFGLETSPSVSLVNTSYGKEIANEQQSQVKQSLEEYLDLYQRDGRRFARALQLDCTDHAA